MVERHGMLSVMNTYLIGDVQGCFDSLQALLQKINFNPDRDRLGFVGDLVNRGPKSAETLRFVSQLKNPLIVLGNHDLHLMALYFLRHQKTQLWAPQHIHTLHNIAHTLHDVLSAPDCNQLIQFLLQQPFMLLEKEFAMIHAGIPPQWSLEKAFTFANEVQKIMHNNPIVFFENIYGNDPVTWSDHLTDWDRTRYIVNAFIRMRFCTQDGTLDLDNKTNLPAHKKYQPWFSWIHPTRDIYFGHWAALKGCCDNPAVFALDTGCAWGGTLTAIRLTDKKRFWVESLEF